MFCFLYEHYLIDSRLRIASAEGHGNEDVPDKYWKYLGVVDITEKSPLLYEKLNEEDKSMEVDEQMFDVYPELNQLVHME